MPQCKKKKPRTWDFTPGHWITSQLHRLATVEL